MSYIQKTTMPILNICTLLTALGLASSLASSSQSSDLLFEFLNTAGAARGVSNAGWSAYALESAAPITGANTVFIAGTAGNPSASNGYLAFTPATPNAPYVAVTTFPSSDVTKAVVTWTMGNSNSQSKVRILLRSGDSWFISDEEYSNSHYDAALFADSDTDSITQRLDLSHANWRIFELEPETNMSIGNMSPPDLSNVSGIGFHVQNGWQIGTNAAIRLDSLTVSPSSP